MTNLLAGTAADPAATPADTRALPEGISRPKSSLVTFETALFGPWLRLLAATRSFFCGHFLVFPLGGKPKE